MSDTTNFDVIIVGGSYSGLSAAMALGRANRRVLIIDDGKPCNRQTPHSHNFITHDGTPPAEILKLARQQVEKYETILFFNGLATGAIRKDLSFEISASSGDKFSAKKVIFATGIRDVMENIPGFVECWGISVLHCPYCHGYEVRNQVTGILGNGPSAFEFAQLLTNWTQRLTAYTNGKSNFSREQELFMVKYNIAIVEKEIQQLEHHHGYLQKIKFNDGSFTTLNVLYARTSFVQQCMVPQSLGCELTEDGYIKADALQKTSVPGIFACGDNAMRMRTVSNAVASGTTAGMAANKEMITEQFAVAG